MASGFWYLEDGRCFARRMSAMAFLVEVIQQELQQINGAELFSEYLAQFIPAAQDESNGYGGFIRKSTGEHIMMLMDLREFSPSSRAYFWTAVQQALRKRIVRADPADEVLIYLLKVLLAMHKRIKRGEAPAELNDMGTHVEPASGKQVGPGWNV